MVTLTWVWLLLLSVVQVARSDETARSNWIVPDGSNEKDFQQTFYNGDKVHLQWAGWDSYYTDSLLDGSLKANLYVVTWEEKDADYIRPLASSRDVSGPGSYDWTVNLDNETLAKDHKYCVVFAEEGYSYTYDGYNIFSSGFLVRNRPTPSPTPTPEAASSSGLQTGAKAAIGVGVAIGGLALLSAPGFLLYRLGRQHQASSPAVAASPQSPGPGSEQSLGKGDYYSVEQGPREMFVPPTDSLSEAPSTFTPVELPSAPREK